MENAGSIYDEEGRIANQDEARQFANMDWVRMETEKELEKRKREGSTDTDIGKIRKEVEEKFKREQTEGLDTEEEKFNLALINKFHEKYPKVPQVEFEQKPCFIVPVADGLNKRSDVVGDSAYWVLTKEAIYVVSFGANVPASAIKGEALLEGIKNEVSYAKEDWRRPPEDRKNVRFVHHRIHQSIDNKTFIDVAESRRQGVGMLQAPSCELSTVSMGEIGVLDRIKDAFNSAQKKYEFIEKQKEGTQKSKESMLAGI